MQIVYLDFWSLLLTWLILLPKETKLLTLFPFMLLLKFHEMISLCFSLLLCASLGKANGKK